MSYQTVEALKERKLEKKMENKQHEITVTDFEGRKLSISLHWDADINDWVETFKVILAWLSFENETINEVFIKDEND